MPNGIYIQTEYHGKLIRKIVCNGEERWFIGSDAGGVAVQRVLLAERLLAPHLPRGARRQRADVPGAGPQGLHRAGI